MTIHYEEYGDQHAPLMLFLHGGGVSGWMWDQQIRYFTQYHCIVPDLPGHGHSHHEIHFSMLNAAKEIAKIIEEKAEDKKVILVGFSLGSQVIIQLLSMKPQLIDFAIINSALVIPQAFAQKWIKPTVKLSFPLIKNRWFSKLQAKTLYISDDYTEQYYNESNQMKAETLVSVLEENMAFAIPSDFKNANSKILVTVGAKEKTMMKQSAKDIVKANQNCTGVMIPSIGHGLPLAKPDFFNQMMETWINKGILPEECIVI